ncbi:MAG: hypothetical protein KF901_03570 [Myxococcales bacterium]|nr:hypothetical protein [Myxococcales bacterium]
MRNLLFGLALLMACGDDDRPPSMDLTFTGVTLQNPSDGTVCRVDGRLRTFGPSF